MEIRELFDLLEKLYKTNVLGLSKLARSLGISYNKLYVFINTLKRMKFEVVPCMNMRFLKLGIILVISDREILDKECKPLFPKGYFALFMVPLDIEFKNIKSIIGSSTSSRVYFIEEAQLPKPLLTKYNVGEDFKVLKSEKLWRKFLGLVDEINRNNIDLRYRPIQLRYMERYRVNKTDLKIMNELVRNPFISSKKLAEKLGISVGKLRRRIASRIEPLMKGYRVSWAPYYRMFNAIFFTILRPGSLPPRTLYEMLSEFPLTVMTAYNSSENTIVNAWLVDSSTYTYARKHLKILESKYGVEIIDTWGYLYSGEEKQVVSCRVLVEYDKRTRKLRLKSSLEKNANMSQ